MGAYLAVNPGGVQDEIPGEITVDPAFGLPAIWISEENRAKAEKSGYTVIDAPTIITTHITHVIKTHAADILTRQMVSDILESVKKTNPAVVAELQTNQNFHLGELQKILQYLLRESVSIRNTVAILETIADYRRITGDVYLISEKVRQRLGRQIVQQYIGQDNMLHAFMVDPEFMQMIAASRVDTINGPVSGIDAELSRAFVKAVQTAFSNYSSQFTGVAVILTPEEGRLLTKRLIEKDMPAIAVLSVPEIPKEISLMGMGNIKPESM